MANSDAQRFLEHGILDYMLRRGLNHTSDVFSREIPSNENPVAIDSPHEPFLQMWWGKSYEAYRSSFGDGVELTAESLHKVTEIVEDDANNGPANPSYGFDHTEANISNVMPVMSSPHLMASSHMMESSGPDHLDTKISDLLSRFDTDYMLLELSPQRDMASRLQPEIGEMGGMLPFASNSGYQMQQMPIVPPEWSARDDRPDINLGGPTLMEPDFHAPANVFLSSLGLSDAGNNISLQHASHLGWPSVEFPGPFSMPTQVDSSGEDVGMPCDTNQRSVEHLPADQKIIAPIGGNMESFGQQRAVQEQINQLGLQSSNKSGIKREIPSSSLASVGKEKAAGAGIANHNTISSFSQRDVGLVTASNSIYALTKIFAAPARSQAIWKGNSVKEINNLHTSKSKLLCCHFNSTGELLATGGHDGKVLIWVLGNNNVYSGVGHSHHVTDVRFRPNSTVFATSSFDRTVKIWDAVKPSNPLQYLFGHGGHVMSIDFHPTKMDLLSSCDSNNEIRLWDVNKGDCKLNFKGGSGHVRFQPRLGDLLASSVGNIINIFDVETKNIRKMLQGHVKDVRSICWDMSGNFLASVSEDSARIWSVSDGKCIHELYSSGNKFQSCTFLPWHSQVLVIGSDKFLELWNPTFHSNITWPYSAHCGIISSLADAIWKGTIASVSHDQCIKIWR